jgi:hypothetical protein
MKKVLLFIASGITVFCLFPIATTQAMPREAESKSIIASNPTNTIVPVLEPCNVITELRNPAPKDNVITLGIQELRGTTIARKGGRPVGNKNPYVERRGHGDSTMGDDYIEEDDGEAKDDEDEDEEFGDDSAVEYNKGLREQESILRDNPDL